MRLGAQGAEEWLNAAEVGVVRTHVARTSTRLASGEPMRRILATAALGAFACLTAVSAAGCALPATPQGSSPPEAPQVFVAGLDGEEKRQLTSGDFTHSEVIRSTSGSSRKSCAASGTPATLEKPAPRKMTVARPEEVASFGII